MRRAGGRKTPTCFTRRRYPSTINTLTGVSAHSHTPYLPSKGAIWGACCYTAGLSSSSFYSPLQQPKNTNFPTVSVPFCRLTATYFFTYVVDFKDFSSVFLTLCMVLFLKSVWLSWSWNPKQGSKKSGLGAGHRNSACRPCRWSSRSSRRCGVGDLCPSGLPTSLARNPASART